jgi:DNA-binding MarR family transcriptional regulator
VSTATTAPPLAATLSAAVGRLRRSLDRQVRALAGPPPLPEAQRELLRLVERRPGVRVHEAAAELWLAPNTVSTLVHRLLDAGLLEREPDLDDGRVARLRLSPAGGELLRRRRDRRHEVLAAQLAALGEDDRLALTRALPALDRVAAALETSLPSAREAALRSEDGGGR